MNYDQVPIGSKAPKEVNAIVEISAKSGVKYELDESTNLMRVDRFLPVAMHYPCNYGFVPQTKCGDGDPMDVLILTEEPLSVGSLITVRPIGVLGMEDEGGRDDKVLTVPAGKAGVFYKDVKSYNDLPEIIAKRIEHFFEYYKKLEPEKWVKIFGWSDAAEAERLIEEARAQYV